MEGGHPSDGSSSAHAHNNNNNNNNALSEEDRIWYQKLAAHMERREEDTPINSSSEANAVVHGKTSKEDPSKARLNDSDTSVEGGTNNNASPTNANSLRDTAFDFAAFYKRNPSLAEIVDGCRSTDDEWNDEGGSVEQQQQKAPPHQDNQEERNTSSNINNAQDDDDQQEEDQDSGVVQANHHLQGDAAVEDAAVAAPPRKKKRKVFCQEDEAGVVVPIATKKLLSNHDASMPRDSSAQDPQRKSLQRQQDGGGGTQLSALQGFANREKNTGAQQEPSTNTARKRQHDSARSSSTAAFPSKNMRTANTASTKAQKPTAVVANNDLSTTAVADASSTDVPAMQVNGNCKTAETIQESQALIIGNTSTTQDLLSRDNRSTAGNSRAQIMTSSSSQSLNVATAAGRTSINHQNDTGGNCGRESNTFAFPSSANVVNAGKGSSMVEKQPQHLTNASSNKGVTVSLRLDHNRLRTLIQRRRRQHAKRTTIDGFPDTREDSDFGCGGDFDNSGSEEGKDRECGTQTNGTDSERIHDKVSAISPPTQGRGEEERPLSHPNESRLDDDDKSMKTNTTLLEGDLSKKHCSQISVTWPYHDADKMKKLRELLNPSETDDERIKRLMRQVGRPRSKGLSLWCNICNTNIGGPKVPVPPSTQGFFALCVDVSPSKEIVIDYTLASNECWERLETVSPSTFILIKKLMRKHLQASTSCNEKGGHPRLVSGGMRCLSLPGSDELVKEIRALGELSGYEKHSIYFCRDGGPLWTFVNPKPRKSLVGQVYSTTRRELMAEFSLLAGKHHTRARRLAFWLTVYNAKVDQLNSQKTKQHNFSRLERDPKDGRLVVQKTTDG